MPTQRLLLLPLAVALAAACTEEKLCPSDQLLCGDRCTAVATDPANCGACGSPCAAGESCQAGACFCPWETTCDGACVDLASDPAHCGACGTACADPLLCSTDDEGLTACTASCAGTGQTACGRACVDLETHRQNCGACGRSCGSNERCERGRCVADLYLACFNSDEVRGATAGLAPAGIPVSVAQGPIGLAWVGDLLFVASARPGGAETLAAVRFDPPGVRVSRVFETDLPNPDIQYLAAHEGLLYLAHSSAGTLLVVTPDGRLVDEVRLAPLGDPNPNPNGIAFAGDEAYLSLNQRGELAVLDVSELPACAFGARSPPCTTEVARIDLAPLASAGASPMPSRIAVVGGRAYVTLWNLDPFFSPPPGSTGRLAVIDVATDSLDEAVSGGGVAGLLDLGPGCLNPADVAALGDTLYVSCGAFDYSNFPEVRITGSGVVPVDLSAGVPTPGPVLPAAADEAPGKLAFCAGAGYVGDRNSGRVFRLDPVTGVTGPVELCPPSNGFAYVADIACGL